MCRSNVIIYQNETKFEIYCNENRKLPKTSRKKITGIKVTRKKGHRKNSHNIFFPHLLYPRKVTYCFNKYVQCHYKHEWQIKVKKLHIFHCFYRFCLVVFIRICVLHTALILFGCISPDMCITYTLVLNM
jgi:hypothetical protein